MSNRREELLSLLPCIPDPLVRAFTQYALSQAPSHFWVKPSSAGKYHPPDEHGSEGLLLHTIRVVRVGKILCLSSPDLDPNVVLPACFLHDLCRYGDGEPGSQYTLPEHPELAAAMVLRLGAGCLDGYAKPIADAVERHTGRWGKVKPETREEWAVHYADNIAACCF